MSEIKLSVCIATFNRGAFIGETLDSIVHQCPDYVEIVVVDGASPDNTEQVVKGYQQRFPCVRYFRQERNKGVDEDFCRAVALARGEYCWLMSDDDVLKPDAVRTVLNATRKGFSLIVANAEVRNADLSDVLERRKLSVDQDRVYESVESEAFFMDAARFLSFIGCVIIKRDIWEQRKKEKYFGTVFIHVGVIFQESVPGQTLIIAQPLLSIRYGNAQWSARGFEIWMIKWPELIWSFSGFSDEAKRKICHREPWRRLTPLLSLRALGVFSLKEYKQWIKPRADSFFLRLAVLFICSLPARMLNFAGIVYFSCLCPSPLNLLDLRKSPAYWKKVLQVAR